MLATCSLTLRSEYEGTHDASWRGSPFDWIRTQPSRRKGAIGERLISGYLACKGFDVIRSPDAEADRIVAGKRAEIKMSTLWRNGSYKFQQFRNQNYAFAICLGISPFDAHCWILSKETILERWATGDISSQHGGRMGNDTAWLSVNPDDVPGWLNDWGGPLSSVSRSIAEAIGQEPLP